MRCFKPITVTYNVILLYTSHSPCFERLHVRNIFEESKLPFLCLHWYCGLILIINAVVICNIGYNCITG